MSTQTPISAEPRQSRQLSRWLLRLPAFLALPFALQLLGFFAWSPMNCRTDEIDIRSGRICYTRYFLWSPVSRRIVANPVADAIDPIGHSTNPAWRIVNTFSPGVSYSPHHRFHDAISQAEELALIWDVAPFSSTARRESAIRLVTVWQRENGCFGASHYLTRLAKVATDRSTDAVLKAIEIQDLPSTEDRDAG